MDNIIDEDNLLDDEQTYETIMEEIYKEVFDYMNSTSNISIVEDMFSTLQIENNLEEEIYNSDNEIE